jgi:hypothetical protein
MNREAEEFKQPGLHLSHELRVQQLERERGQIAADISALRTELRTEVKNIKDQLTRIEDMLEERPTRPELEPLRKSKGPSLEVDGKRLWMKTTGALPIVFVVMAIAIMVMGWLLIHR